MIYITQLIYINEGREADFHQFEDLVLPLLEQFNGKLLLRLRPGPESFVVLPERRPYEIHLVSFETEADFDAYIKDDTRQQYIDLKEKSVNEMQLIKGEEFR